MNEWISQSQLSESCIEADILTWLLVCAANGYVRSEAVCVMFLQKAQDAKRVYAKVLHAKTNSDGHKDKGITYPSRERQTELMEQLYEEIGIKPTSVDYLEAHGTGTRVSLLNKSIYRV